LKGTRLRHKITALPVALTADGSGKLYRVEAEYVYALNRPPKNDEKFNVGILPFTDFTQDENKFDPDAYSSELGP